MSNQQQEPRLFVAAFSFASDNPYPIEVKRGLTLLETDPIVSAHPKAFVPQSAGEQALVHRAKEVERATEQLREKQKAEQRAARIANGTRPEPSDDASAESLKKQVAGSDGKLQLVHNEWGNVIGAKTKS